MTQSPAVLIMQRHLAPFDGLLGQVGHGAVRLGAAEEVGHVAQLLQGLRTCLQRAGRDGGTLRAGRRQGGAGGSHSRNRHRSQAHPHRASADSNRHHRYHRRHHRRSTGRTCSPTPT